MKINAAVSLRFIRPTHDNPGGMKIEVIDNDSRIEFLELLLNENQTLSVLANMAEVQCTGEVRGLDKVGKTRESKKLTFEIPKCDYESIEYTTSREAKKKD